MAHRQHVYVPAKCYDPSDLWGTHADTLKERLKATNLKTAPACVVLRFVGFFFSCLPETQTRTLV